MKGPYILKCKNGDNSSSKMVWTHYGLVREGLWIEEEGAQRVEDAFSSSRLLSKWTEAE